MTANSSDSSETASFPAIKGRRGLWFAFAFLALAVTVIAISATSLFAIPKGSVGIVVTSSMQGGMCVEGPCEPIGVTQIAADGHMTPGQVDFTDAEMKRLTDLIASTDLNGLKISDSAFCDSYVDGRDLVYTFPQVTGDKTFAPCMFDDAAADELFSLLAEMMNRTPGIISDLPF